MKLLDRSYFEQNDVLFLAEDLLGKTILTEFEGIITSAWITETEAYKAPDDKASHAYGNRRTKRTEIMFGPGGYAYIYLNYGIHHLFNIVAGPRETAHAILIRAIFPCENAEFQLKRRNKSGSPKDPTLYNGPGKLSQALGIKTNHNGLDLCNSMSPIKIYESGLKIIKEDIEAGPRIGIDYAEEWIDKPWRFYIDPARLDKLFG